MPTHTYQLSVRWTGNTGEGTASYRSYSRNADILAPGAAPAIPASSDPAFRGDPDRWNPEQLLVASLSHCHMLWYLHLCSTAGVVVVDYTDEPTGLMEENGAGRFTAVTLRPAVTVTDASMFDKATALHHEAHDACFIANSVNFPVAVEPTVAVAL